MSVAGGVAVREKLFDELERLNAEEGRIRSRRTEIRNALRILQELGAIDLDSEEGNGRRPTSEADSEAPEPRVAPDPSPPPTDDPETFPCEHPGCSYLGDTQAQLNGHQSAHRSVPSKKHETEEVDGARNVRCPACDQGMHPRSLAGHIAASHKLPGGTQFNPEAFDRMLVDPGLSSVELARQLTARVGAGSNSTIDNWRKGRSQPGLPFVEALAEILGCRTGDLVWRKK